jgi:HSP20 family protein
MSLVKFRKRRPWGNFMPSDFFDNGDLFNNQLLNNPLMNNELWNNQLNEPALNIKETDKAFEVELAAPGYSKKDFEINVDEGCLNILAENSHSEEEKENNYTRKEFSYNSFEKRLQLPDSVKEEDVKATYKDGVLRFNLAKKEEAKARKPKKIEIA